MRGAAIAAVWIVSSCTPAAGPPVPDPAAHDDPVLDRYRCENFLDGERPPGTGFEAGLRASMPPSGTDPTEELHLRIGTPTLDIAVRRRRRAAERWDAYHAAWTSRGRLRVICGDFVPDAGIGLISSARRFAGAFTSSRPLTGSGLRRWTGFYDGFIRGGGIVIAAGRASVSLLAGTPGVHAAGGTAVEGRTVSGLRAAAVGDGVAGGVFLLREDPGSERSLTGLEGAVELGPATVAAEVSIGEGMIGSAWGCTMRLGPVRAAALAFHAPFGSTGSLSCIPGATRRRGATQGGMAAALRARLPSRFFLDASLEGLEWRDGFRTRRDGGVRVRLEARRRAGTLMLTLREDAGRGMDCLPVPPVAPSRVERSRSVEAAGLAAAGARVRLRGAFRHVTEDRSSGWMAAAGVRIESDRGGARIESGRIWCRSERGRIVFRFHEPSIPGAYPWRVVSDNGTRTYIVLLMRFRGLSASAGCSWEDAAGIRGEACVRFKY